jgi:hypothetical protein
LIIKDVKTSVVQSKKGENLNKSKFNNLDPFINLTRNHNASPNNLEILLTEGLSISKKKDFRIFESLSPKKNNFIFNNKFISEYNSDNKCYKRKELISKVNNPLNDSDDNKLNKQRQLIKDNFISIKEKIQFIKESVINEKKPILNHVNIEKKNLIEDFMVHQKDSIISDYKSKNNSRIIGKSKILDLDIIKEDQEIRKTNDENEDIGLEERLNYLKDKIMNKNSKFEKFTQYKNSKINNDNIEKIKSSFPKENRFNNIIDAMKKIRNVSSLDSMDTNDPTFKR